MPHCAHLPQNLTRLIVLRPYRDDRFDGITLRPGHDSILNRQLASHSHYELGGGPFHLSVGSTDGEL
jgi:hypothetical protein